MIDSKTYVCFTDTSFLLVSVKFNFNEEYVVWADSKTFLLMNFEYNVLIRSSKLSTRKGTKGLVHWSKTRKWLRSAAMPLKN